MAIQPTHTTTGQSRKTNTTLWIVLAIIVAAVLAYAAYRPTYDVDTTTQTESSAPVNDTTSGDKNAAQNRANP